MGGDGSQVTFGDTQPWLAGIAQSAALGARFHDPQLLAFADLMARENARWERIYSENPRPQGIESKNYKGMLLKKYRQTPTATWPDMSDRGAFLPYGFLWRGLEPAEELSLPTMATLGKIHWGVLRSSPKNPDLVLQAKGRPSGMLQFHEIHQDGGSFVLQAGGDPILIDPGYFPGMQNAGADAAKHSVPVIDGRVPVGGSHSSNGRSIAEFASVITNAWGKENQRGFTIDTTLPYSDPAQAKMEKTKDRAANERPAPAPRRVHWVFVMNGSEGVVLLDDIVPGEGAPGDIVTRFQTAQIPELQDGTNELTLSGWKTKVGMQIDGEGVSAKKLGPFDFQKSWVFKDYADAGYFSWHSVELTYKADPKAPLVTIFQPESGNGVKPRAVVQRSEGRITVSFPSGTQVAFEEKPEGWRSLGGSFTTK